MILDFTSHFHSAGSFKYYITLLGRWVGVDFFRIRYRWLSLIYVKFVIWMDGGWKKPIFSVI